MANKKQKSEFEMKWAQPFVDHLNMVSRSDYVIMEHDNKTTPTLPDIDVVAISKSSGFPTLYLQLTEDRRHSGESIEYGTRKTPIFSCDNVFDAITKKAKKYTKQRKDYSQIVLLVQGGMSKPTADMDLDASFRIQASRYPFKAIYYISPPKISGANGVNNYEGWFVIPIKKLE